MKKIDYLNIVIRIDEGSPERDKFSAAQIEYGVSDTQDPSMAKNGMLPLPAVPSEADGLLFAAYTAINKLEGTSYVPNKPQSAPSQEELALLEIHKKRLQEYPSVQAWIEADYDTRVKGDSTKRDALDAQVSEVKKKYPLPNKITPSAWAKVKAFFGF